MRRLKKLSAAVLMAALSTGMVMAQDLSEAFESDNGRNEIRLEEVSGTTYKLVYPVKNSGKVYVKIYDQKNHLVHSEKIRNNYGFTRPYDLTRLADGNYKFLIWSETGKTALNLTLKKPVHDLNVALEETDYRDAYKLIVKGVIHEPLYVNIYDDKAKLVYEETLDVNKDFSRVYSFNADVENPTFIVTQLNNSVSVNAR